MTDDATGFLITVHALEVITNQFAPLMKKIHMYLFWEEAKKQLPNSSDFLVHPSSAAPHIYDMERCGIPGSNHFDMTKFRQSNSAYRTVISALVKYCHSAPAIIAYRWKRAAESLARMRRSEASELTGLLLDIPDKVPVSTECNSLPHLNECLEACPNAFKDFHGLKLGLYRRLTLLLQPTLAFSIREMIEHTVKCGILYAITGDFAKSAHHLALAKDSLITLVGVHNSKTTATMLGLADVLWGLGRLREAISLQEQVVRSRQKALGPDHRETLQALDSLGQSFWLNGQYCEALQIQQQAAEEMRIHLGEGDDDTLKALDHLGVTLGAWHRYTESRDIHQKVLDIRTQKLDESDLRVLETKNNLAMALLDLNELGHARALMEEVYNGRKAPDGQRTPVHALGAMPSI